MSNGSGRIGFREVLADRRDPGPKSRVAVRPVPARASVKAYVGKYPFVRGFSSTKRHYGVDLACPSGTPVKALLSGTISESSYNASRSPGSPGRMIKVNHGGGLSSAYMHLSKSSVKIGQAVGQGQVIGYSGNTGYSTGPHIHFQLELNGVRIDPAGYVQTQDQILG